MPTYALVAVTVGVMTGTHNHAGLENHHAVLDVWAKHNVPNYKSRAASSTTVAPTPAEHAATKSVYRDWLQAHGPGVVLLCLV
ncbi:hypothetical protein AB0M54_12535 [Actinoplanes sp. NPDC051470]|uniref:hypothetical protein n=1 Tax=Actinoplanes sp. NPDC051470 TaxID=3157224 RepID=UPI0034200BAA